MLVRRSCDIDVSKGLNKVENAVSFGLQSATYMGLFMDKMHCRPPTQILGVIGADAM